MKELHVFTEGPWEIAPGSEEAWNCIEIHTRDGNHCIAIVPIADDDQKSGTAMANARLIAAAPELLDALRNIAEKCHVYCAESMDIDDWAVRDAVAAIAKASGECSPDDECSALINRTSNSAEVHVNRLLRILLWLLALYLTVALPYVARRMAYVNAVQADGFFHQPSLLPDSGD